MTDTSPSLALLLSSHQPTMTIHTTCSLSFHGAAANSCPHSLLWVLAPRDGSSVDVVDLGETSSSASTGGAADNVSGSDGLSSRDVRGANIGVEGDALVDTVLYASSGVINLATSTSNGAQEGGHINLMNVSQTLVTRTLDQYSITDDADGTGIGTTKKMLARGEAVEDAAALRSVTALSWIDGGSSSTAEDGFFGIVAAFSDGTVTSWRWSDTNIIGSNASGWKEHVLIGHDPSTLSSSSSDATVRHYHKDNTAAKLHVQESIADISATNLTSSAWLVGTASSSGLLLCVSHVGSGDAADEKVVKGEEGGIVHTVYVRQIGHSAASSVHFVKHVANDNINSNITTQECFLFAGSASPRNNKVWVYTIPYSSNTAPSSSWAPFPLLTIGDPTYHGHLLGHQDWITCFAWWNINTNGNNESGEDDGDDMNGGRKYEDAILASSGHDAKIRLWKFSSLISADTTIMPVNNGVAVMSSIGEEDIVSEVDDENDEDEANIDDLEEEEGEARLVIQHDLSSGYSTTAVSLEALLLGHEEGVTSLNWRRSKQQTDKPCLLSSSMDRTILLWMEEEDDDTHGGGGVWVPISRVGSAGGILGGSIGASLMGFVDACFSPEANRIVGHGYGGSLHFWTQNQSGKENHNHEEEDTLMSARWIADPCITGHFCSVEDMAWDTNGEYLLTVSSDQTTRLWAEVPMTASHRRWMEVGRPQVHGYDMTAITCVGGLGCGNDSGEPRHRFVSGADEKILRVFDAPLATLRLLRTLKKLSEPTSRNNPAEEGGVDSSSWRVERAFLPSLGLSNKATAECEQESAKYAGPTNDDDFVEALDTVEGGTIDELKLPSERDLGVTTLWPETRKLFGHESELVCLDAYRAPEGTDRPSLIASSCKARNDVASAAIRLWNVKQGKCVDILKVRSTIWDRREYHLFYARYLMIIVYNRAGIDRQYQRCRFQVMVDIW